LGVRNWASILSQILFWCK